MKPRIISQTLFALAGCSLLAMSSASALTYYWDGNDAASGFGAAGGTWAAPTTGTVTSGWSTSSGGTATVDGNSVSTSTADLLNFGTSTASFGLATGSITVSGTVNSGDMTFGSQSGSITFSGGTINFGAAVIISGNGLMVFDSAITGADTSITRAGVNGTLRLNNANNSYTGKTIIVGALEATSLTDGGLNSSIGASTNAAGNLVFGAGSRDGTLRYIGATNTTTDRLLTIGSINSNANIESSGVGTLNFTNTGTLTVSVTAARNFVLGGTNTGSNIFNPLITNGAGAAVISLTKTGAGSWILANNLNSYTGATTLNSGTLTVNKMADYDTVSPIGKGVVGSAIAFAGGALVYVGAGDNTNRLIQVSGGNGTILNNGANALNFTESASFNLQGSTATARALTFGGSNGGMISGTIQNNTGTAPALSLVKIGTGTWTLGGTNTYSGNTDMNAGTLKVKSVATSITQTLGALRSQSADGTFHSEKSGSGNLSTTFSGYSRSAGATGNIVSTGGTNGTDNSVNITGTGTGFLNAGLYFGGSEFAARNSDNGFVRALQYGTDASTSAQNTISGSTHVKLTTSPAGNQGNTTLLSLNLQGGGVNWTSNAGTNLTTPGILKSGGGSQSSITGGNVSGGSNTELVVRTDISSDELLISSNLTQGSGALTKSGAGTLTLSGTNTYTGQTHVNAGTLSIGANVNLGSQTTGATLNLKGGKLQATGTFGLFNGSAGTNNRAVTLLDQSTIEVTDSNTLTIAGVISNNAGAGFTNPGFTKTGSGTLILSNSNTFTGAITISEGTLTISGANQAANSITFTGGALGLDTGTSVTATRASVDLTNGTIKVSGATGAARYTLLTAASITGTPVLATPVPGYELQLIDGTSDELQLVQTSGAPEIAVDQNGNINSGDSKPFGTVTIGSGNNLIFTISNTGASSLNLTGSPLVTVTGADAADFTVTAAPASSLATSETTTFTVRFAPLGTTGGPRSAQLTIANNDPDEGAFIINVSGIAQTPYQAWAGGATFGADANGDGVSNGLAWLLGATDPNVVALNKLPAVSQSGGNLVLSFQTLKDAYRGGASLSVEHSSDLGVADAWLAALVTDAGTPANNVTFSITSASSTLNNVTATISSNEATTGKLFGRVKAVTP